MNKIDFIEYPKILPYVEELLSKSHFKPSPCNPLTEDAFIEIITNWIDYYEKYIDIMVKNTLLVYKLTNYRFGYEILGEDWEKVSSYYTPDSKTVDYYTPELLKNEWKKQLTGCIAHLYQSWLYYDKEYSSGIGGTLFSTSFTIRFVDSDYKKVEKIAVSNFGMNINLGLSLHSEIDIYEQ